MLIPIIKDFNNAFSYLISNSVEKTKEVFDPVSKSLLDLSNGQSDQSGTLNDILKISWTTIRICFLFLIQTIQYIVSFQWLRDFAYLPISIPNNMLGSNENNTFIQNFNNSVVSLVGDRQNVLQRFLFSNQTIAKPVSGLAVSDHNLPYQNFILGLPNVTHNGAPINSWSLSFLSNQWFDPLTVPVNFLSTGLESSSKNISQLSLPEQLTSDLRISNLILMSILICIATGFSSFFNSFFICFPLSLSNLLSLRYLIIQKFWAGSLSVLGIVCGEIVFMLFLILPPPFIQITLVYLESIWPYIIGLSLIIFIIFDLISNPYTNTMSLYQTNNKISSGTGSSSLTKQTSMFTGTNWTQYIPIKLGNHGAKIFGFSFLLALTEQSCYFSFFGSLNLSATGNFLDTYLFAASKSPIILFFSCVGFLIGSFLSITIYNFIIAKTIFVIASLGIKIKQYNLNFIRNWVFNRQTDFRASMDSTIDSKNDTVPQVRFIIYRIYIRTKNNLMSRLKTLFSSIKSKDFLKSLLLRLKNFLQLFIRYLPGGKRIVFFLFPGQANSYKSDFQSKYARSRSPNIGFRDQSVEAQLTSQNNQISSHTVFPMGLKTEPTNTLFSIENKIENMLRTDSLNASSSSSPSIPESSRDSLFLQKTNNQPSVNTSQLGGSAFYNKIDKVILTCLITLSFTTIPYYSFDYLINSFFGFIPQDQILNAHSLRVNFPDYTNLLGITLSDNNSVINTDVSLYDRAHFMYGEWPNSFESLNYQGELMWTNLRDHRRQKRTRRSTRLKFKTLKTKIATSWKEFKRSSGFSGSYRPSAFSEETKWDSNFSKDPQASMFENSQFKKLSKPIASGSSQEQDSLTVYEQMNDGPSKQISKAQNKIDNNVYEENRSKAQKSLRNTNNLSNVFYKIFLASPFKTPPAGQNASIFSNGLENTETEKKKNDFNQVNNHTPLGEKSMSQTFETNLEGQSKTFEPISQIKNVSKNEIMPKIPEELRLSTSLNETIKPLSTSTFIDLSGGEKYIKTYPKNWKRVITEKYYQNPIYKTVLSNDLKNFLKREPLTQQLTNNQENELYFLRVKMAHYYDSLRFYFTLKEQVNTTRLKADGVFKSLSENNQSKALPIVPLQTKRWGERWWGKKLNDSFLISNQKTKQNTLSQETPKLNAFGSPVEIFKREPTKKNFETIWNDKRKPRQSSSTPKYEPIITGGEESLKSPPFQFKSMTSMNYRQQFKGTLKTVKQLFAVSLPELVSGFSNAQYKQNSNGDKDYNFAYKESHVNLEHGSESTWTNKFTNKLVRPNQLINRFSESTRKTEPIEKSYKYDKYLFNEYAYPKNEFLHEEGRGFTNRKSNISHFRESNSQNSTFSPTGIKSNMSSNETTIARGYRGIGLATKNIYNMFGSNDPFYVGWDQNLRKFVLTSRILSRASALNYNATNPKFNIDQITKQKRLDFNNNNSLGDSNISDLDSASSLRIEKNYKRSLTNQIKNKNNTKELETSSDIPIYSGFASRSSTGEALGGDPAKDIKRLEEKKLNFNQQLIHIYRPYSSWPFFKHQLKNLPNRPYFVLYENYLNILNKRIHLFRNININDIDTKSLTFLYSYSFNNNVKKYVSQLPINIYKQSMRPSSLENLFTPTSNARSSFLWPGSIMPAWEHYFW